MLKLEEELGPVRDFNGGIIARQNEVFQALFLILGKSAHQHRLLLDTFFHNIYPVERRSFIQPKILKTFFLLLVQLLELAPGERTHFKKLQTKECCIVVVDQLDFQKKPNIQASLTFLKIPLTELITVKFEFDQRHILGYLYLTEDRKIQQNVLKIWEKEIGF